MFRRMSTPADLADRLRAADQPDAADFLLAASPEAQQKLTGQLADLDLDGLPQLVEQNVVNKPPLDVPTDLSAPPLRPATPPTDQAAEYDEAKRRGEQLLREGKVAGFLVAGGQGTRLGYDGPKGEYPVTPIKDKPLFQVFAEQLKAWGETSGKPVPWYVMTSALNDGPTREFFEKHHFFGLDRQNVMFFEQEMMPAFSFDGKLLFASDDSLALSPGGHGGSLRALAKSGALDDMKTRGVEHISYFQVDNPLVHAIDPLFLGMHDLTDSDMSSKALTKAEPMEKVGNFATSGDKLMVIEYSDLPDELAEQTNADGTLKFNAGSIAIHALRRDFVEKLNEGGRLSLPWHRAEKKVPHVGDPSPNEPNGVKLEQFVFDAVPLAQNALLLETKRDEEFSPVKNAQGNDSPATSRRDQIRRAAKWLETAGIDVPRTADGEPDCVLEISPTFAATSEQLAAKNLPPTPIQPGARQYFGE
jgi:UDP-N-acetylglucosamine/UDP-N-acetylgalactosamine diphosphorylase